MKNIWIRAIGAFVAAAAVFALAACGADSANIETAAPMEIHFGETFRARIEASVASVGATEHMSGQYFGISNEADGWHLNITWREADNFFGNVPEDWADADENARRAYFADFLIDRNMLDSDHEITDINVALYFPADGLNPPVLADTPGQMVQFEAHGRHQTSIAIEFYSFKMQADNEGAFFIDFLNLAEDAADFERNQAVFADFLDSIQLMRFHR